MRNILLKLYLVLFLMLSVVSCKKNDAGSSQGPTLTINRVIGTVYADCNFNPEVNREVYLVIYTNATNLTPLFSASGSTGTTGKFSIAVNQTYSEANYAGMSVQLEGDSNKYSWFPDSSQSIVLRDTIHLKMNLLADNPYNAMDTLYYRVNDSTNYIIGPFHSATYSLNIAPFSHAMSDEAGEASVDYLFWAIGINQISTSAANSVSFKRATCSSSDTATIVLN